MTIHALKTWPSYFNAVERRHKPFEIRKADRNYMVNDILQLKEFVPCPSCRGTGKLNQYTVAESACPDCVPTEYTSDARTLRITAGGRYTGRMCWRVITYILTADEFPGIAPGYVVMGLS